MLKKIIALIFIFTSLNSYAGCINEASVTKWEVLASDQVVAYSADKYLAILKFWNNALKVGGNVTLRFFSPTICQSDTVIVNGSSTTIRSVELIRNK